MKKTPSNPYFFKPDNSSFLIKETAHEKEFPGWKDTFESAMDIIALISNDFDILKINKVGYKNLGKKPDEVIGKKCYKVVHGLNAPIKGCACKIAQESGKNTESEIFDRGRYYLTTAAPMYDKDNNFIAFTHTVKDITMLKEAEKSLRSANDLLEEKVQKRTAELLIINKKLKNENVERRKSEEALKISRNELQKQREVLEQKNAALNEIIAQIEIEKNKIRNNITANIEKIIFPTLEKLTFHDNSKIYVRLIKNQLEEITSEYAAKINHIRYKLTPREAELCNYIKSGLSSKEISNHLNISLKTVDKHRRNIRKKLNLTNCDFNLTSYLQNLS